jgi:hypothetical protein
MSQRCSLPGLNFTIDLLIFYPATSLYFVVENLCYRLKENSSIYSFIPIMSLFF